MVLDHFNDGAQRLLLVLCLPFIDGVFATLLVTGAVETFSNVLVVALTIFTGAGALAVLYSSADTREEAVRLVHTVAPFILAGAVAVSLVAPVFEQLFHVHRLSYAAGLAVFVIAAKLLDIRKVRELSTHGIILTGFVLSIKNPAAFTLSTTYLVPAVTTAVIAVIALYMAAYVNPDRMALTYIQRGGGLVLILIGLSLFGLNIPSELTLGVLGTSIAAAFKGGSV